MDVHEHELSFDVCMCIYVCMCVCIHVCMCVCVYVCMYVCMYIQCMYVIFSQLEKLWNSFQLHRKHYSEFKMRGSGRHVLFIAVSLKPLVLRDFLNEFYADPKQMVHTHIQVHTHI